MKFPMTEMPHFIRQELEKLQEVIKPIMKKTSRYFFWSFPLVFLSIFNLFLLLFVYGSDEATIFTIILYSIVGALGFALSKEAKVQQAEMQKLSLNYVVGRIKKSDKVSESTKVHYIKLVREHPLQIMNHFVNFLKVENRS